MNQQAALAAKELWLRRAARKDLNAWAELNGFVPAAHHRYLNDRLMDLTHRRKNRLIVLMPPGSAKSTYASVLFPPWYLAQHPTHAILACSYSATLAARFGKRCRNLINQQQSVLRYRLAADTQAADDWATSLGGIYFAAGVGSGIAGHRADFGLIDDPIGTQEDADSEPMREKVWDWYTNDFVPRLKPGAVRMIIANRRHELDLVGMILDPKNGEADKWEVIRFPMEAERNDPLGRMPGTRLWAEWFTEEMMTEAKRQSRTWSGLYQQRPTPEEGDYFKARMLMTYNPGELPSDLRYYGGADFAITEASTGNLSCFLAGGIDTEGVLWILPKCYWGEHADAAEQIEGLLDLCRTYPFITLWAEKGHISKSMKPFLRKRMREEQVFINIEEVTPAKAKDVRARSIQGRMSMGMVRFPKFAPWWPEAEAELLTFPAGRSDDFVDALAHLGAGIDKMVAPRRREPDRRERPPIMQPSGPITMDMIKKQDRFYKRLTGQYDN